MFTLSCTWQSSFQKHTHTKGGCINRRWDLGQDVPTEGRSGQSAALTPPLHLWAVSAPFRSRVTWQRCKLVLTQHGRKCYEIFCCTNIFLSLIKRTEVSQELVVFPTFTLCLLAVSECVRLSRCCPSLTGFRGQAAVWRLGSVRFLLPPKTPSALSECHTQTCRTLVTDWMVTEGYICFI